LTSYDGDWKGTTAQGKTIVLRVTSGRVTVVRFGYSGSGSTCSVEGTTNATASSLIATDAFSISSNASTFSYAVSGAFVTTSSVAGTLTFNSQSPAGTLSCSVTGSTTWAADKLPAAPSYDGAWAGQTSAGKAISFTVTDNQIVSISSGYAITGGSGCFVDTTFSEPLSSPIVAGEADFSKPTPPLSFSGMVTFTSATDATGNLRISYFDTSTTPFCMGSLTPTFSATRQ
jgi:hypothetical protein